MTNKMTSVMGRISENAATPSAGTRTMRISSVPYAEEEMPSGDSTPSASGLDSRCSPRSWLTSGGPSSRRLVVYQNVSGRPLLLSSKPVAFRVATICAFRPVYTLSRRQRLLTITTGVDVTRRPLDGVVRGVIVALLGGDYPVYRAFTRVCQRGRRRHNPRLGGQVLSVRARRGFHDDNTGRRAECSGGQQGHVAPVAAAQAAGRG